MTGARTMVKIATRVLAGATKLKSQVDLLAMAMQFPLAHLGCSTITVGMKTRKQVEENVAAVSKSQTYDWPKIIATLEGKA